MSRVKSRDYKKGFDSTRDSHVAPNHFNHFNHFNYFNHFNHFNLFQELCGPAMVPPVEYADFKEKAFVKKKLAEQKLKGK